MLYVGSGL